MITEGCKVNDEPDGNGFFSPYNVGLASFRKFPSHQQSAFSVLSRGDVVECDEEIVSTVLALNDIPGVFTTNSCWSVDNVAPGYINIVDETGDFFKFLEVELGGDMRYLLDMMTDTKLMLRPSISFQNSFENSNGSVARIKSWIRSKMNYRSMSSADLRGEWWNRIRDLSIKYREALGCGKI